MDRIGFYVVFFLILGFSMYFLIYRPRRKQAEQRQKTLEDLKKGDRIMTVGGIYGLIESISDDSVVLKVESGAQIRVARGAVAGKLNAVIEQLQKAQKK